MSDRYVIQWKSKVNGRAGKGSKEFDRQEAERLVQELNAEYPEIQHEVIVAPRQTQPEGTPDSEEQPQNSSEPVHVRAE